MDESLAFLLYSQRSSFIITIITDVQQITWSGVLCIKRPFPVWEEEINSDSFLLFDSFMYVPTYNFLSENVQDYNTMNALHYLRGFLSLNSTFTDTYFIHLMWIFFLSPSNLNCTIWKYFIDNLFKLATVPYQLTGDNVLWSPRNSLKGSIIPKILQKCALLLIK